MGPLLNDWILARMMSAPKKDDSIIYRLENYVCDGTANTAINTGIYLFDTNLYPNGFSLYFDFTVDNTNVSLASYLRCRNATQPYNGFTVRRRRDNANETHIQLNNLEFYIHTSNQSRHIVTIEKQPISNKYIMQLDGGYTMEQKVTNVVSPLVIGGELLNDTTQQWNNTRFAKCNIYSLVITKL